jgi:hypothetical protein
MSELGHIVGRPFKPGQSGNPSGLPGRPLGSRTAFSQGFLDDMAKTWRDKGRQTMEWTADNQPATFFAVCARLIGLEAEIDAYRQKAERAEQWLHMVYKEIEDRFLKQDAPRRARR